ncbi:fibronectin type III domain-containing protein [Pirellulales bacterium]|nr:fibronectin type III domain-containing protein [Pirellulales bacterium]
MFYEKFFGIFDRLRKQPLQQKKNTPRVSRSRRYQRNSCSSLEQLEPRIALSATSIAQEAEGDLPNGWGVITLDSNEDDLYLRATRQIDSFGTLREVIEYSENASFTSPGSITNFTGWYEDILVTAGTSVNYNSFGRGDDATKGASPFFTFPGAEDPSLTPNGWTVPTDDDAYHFVPGTVGGSVTLEHEGQFRTLSYIPRYLYDADDGRMGNGVDALFFNEAGVPQLEGEITLNEPSEEPGGEPTEIKITVTGNIDYDGDIRFTYKLSETERFTPSGGSHVNTFYETPIVPEGPSAVTLAAGRDFFLGLQVDLPGPDSSINIASPIVTNTANDNDIVLAASMVEVDAPITSKSNFIVTTTSRALSSDLPIGGARATVVEDFRTNTKIISPEFGVSVADDDRTALRSRAAVVVTASGGWDATRLSVRGIQSDFVFAGDVNASEQSYFLRTSSEQESFRFVTEGEGVLTGATVDVTLDNVELVSATDSVVHDVFLSTNLDSLRISAEGDNSVQTSINSSTFDIAIQEEDTLDIDAVVRTGAGFQVTAVGAVQLTSSIDSFGDVVIQSQSTVSGEAEISTVNGTVTLSGSEVAVTGGIQVLNSNYDETTTDVRLTATSGPLVFGAISATNGITLIQDSPNTLNTGVRSVGTVVGNKLDIVADGNVELATNVSEAVVVSGAAVTIDEEDDAVFSIVATGLTTLTARGVDPLGEDVNGNGVLDSGEDTNGNAVLDEGTALVATVRDTSELIVSAPKGSVEVLAVTSDVLTVGNIQSLVGFNAADTRAAGNVSIRSTQGDLVVLDAPQAGVGVLNARAASALTGNLAGTFAFNQPGITPSTITASGNGSLNDTLNLSTIFPGFDTTNRLRVRDVVLLRGQANTNENGLYRITALGGQLRPWILTRTTTTSVTSGLPVNSRIAVQDGEFAGESFRVKAYGTTLNVTPLHVAAGYKRSPDEISVRAVTAAALIGNFTETDGGQIVGSSVEDVNFNGVLDPGEDVVNGVIDTEDTNGNGVIDTEDTNGNGVLDAGEDVNSNGVIDTEDTNGNGVLDQVGAGLRSHPSFTSLSERTFNYSAEASQYDFGDRNNNVNSEIGVPLVATLAPTSLSWEPGRQLIRLNWIAPETNSSTGAIGGYRIQVMKGGVTWSVDTGSTTTRYDLEEFNNSSLIDGDEYQVSVAAVLVDENGSELLPPNNLSEFSSYVTAIPAQPAGAPIRRPATRF